MSNSSSVIQNCDKKHYHALGIYWKLSFVMGYHKYSIIMKIMIDGNELVIDLKINVSSSPLLEKFF